MVGRERQKDRERDDEAGERCGVAGIGPPRRAARDGEDAPQVRLAEDAEQHCAREQREAVGVARRQDETPSNGAGERDDEHERAGALALDLAHDRDEQQRDPEQREHRGQHRHRAAPGGHRVHERRERREGHGFDEAP